MANRKTIMIIDDDANYLFLLKKALAKLDFNVETAEDGLAALEKIKTLTSDLIILDIILPFKNGLEILDLIKENRKLNSKPIMILTNVDDSEKIRQAIIKGADVYCIKSDYSISEIVQKASGMI
jgi:DNA-binding response OmpR family regulator